MDTNEKTMTAKERFISLCEEISREGIKELMGWLENNDFYTAPASARFHGAYNGGLVEHSLNVYDELCRLLSVYPEVQISTETALICSLFHDLCKINMYDTEKRNRKNSDGVWESYDAYTIKEKFCYGGHGAKSVFLIQHFMHLTPEEAVAIHCHMSSWEDGAGRSVGSAFEQFPLAWLVHVADEAATFIKEKKEV